MRKIEHEQGVWLAVVRRALMFAVLWGVCTQGEVSSWVIGGPTIVIATLASVVLLPPVAWRWRLSGLVRFVPYFLVRSVLGSVDVARRALHPHLPLAPLLVEYPLRLQDGLARVFLVNTVSLLPGTLAAELHAQHLTVHALDGSVAGVSADLKVLEQRVADLFGTELSGSVVRTESARA